MVVSNTFYVRLVDESGNLIDLDLAKYIEIDFNFDKPFEINPIPFTNEGVNEYEIKTDSSYCLIVVRIGRIELFRYEGEPKNLDIVIPNEKLEALKVLVM